MVCNRNLLEISCLHARPNKGKVFQTVVDILESTILFNKKKKCMSRGVEYNVCKCLDLSMFCINEVVESVTLPFVVKLSQGIGI